MSPAMDAVAKHPRRQSLCSALGVSAGASLLVSSFVAPAAHSGPLPSPVPNATHLRVTMADPRSSWRSSTDAPEHGASPLPPSVGIAFGGASLRVGARRMSAPCGFGAGAGNMDEPELGFLQQRDDARACANSMLTSSATAAPAEASEGELSAKQAVTTEELDFALQDMLDILPSRMISEEETVTKHHGFDVDISPMAGTSSTDAESHADLLLRQMRERVIEEPRTGSVTGLTPHERIEAQAQDMEEKLEQVRRKAEVATGNVIIRAPSGRRQSMNAQVPPMHMDVAIVRQRRASASLLA